jgi:sulfate adenylyltransferase subunit 2
MDHLEKLENNSIYIIREAYHQFQKVAALWSIGKDSTTLLYLIRKAFLGEVPFPVVHIDTGYKFKEIYEFRDKYAKEWNLKLIVHRNEKAIAGGMGPNKAKLECCTQLKTNALKDAINKHGFRALYLGIRRDEHGIRAKERVFSPRDEDFEWDYKNQPPELWDQYKSKAKEEEHLRVHPLPVVSLYFAKNGKRFRSIGCEPCVDPVVSNADTLDKIIQELKETDVSERSGRAQDKESDYMMQKLRALGYM